MIKTTMNGIEEKKSMRWGRCVNMSALVTATVLNLILAPEIVHSFNRPSVVHNRSPSVNANVNIWLLEGLSGRYSSSRRRNWFLLHESKTALAAHAGNATLEVSPIIADVEKQLMENGTAVPPLTLESEMAHEIKPLVEERKTEEIATTIIGSKRQRFLNALPGRRRSHMPLKENADRIADNIDKTILKTAIPSMINMAVVPLVNSVDTFWVGRMGIALALAGQAAANQAFFTIYFLINYLPTITAPLVATAVGSGNTEEAQQRVCESLFLSNILGLIGTFALVFFPHTFLNMIIESGAPAMEYAAPYLRFRALSMIPALAASTGFAAFRGMLDTVTPLKVSLGTNVLNLILDPLLIFYTPLGVMGAACATALAELASGVTYMGLLFKRKLARLNLLLKPPSMKSMLPLLLGGASMLGRSMALNVGFVFAARRAQMMDPTGVAAAAYGIVMQIYSVGVVMHVAMQGTTAALVPATKAKSGEQAARDVADRTYSWSILLGLVLGISQYLALPFLVPMFTPLPEVQEAIRIPGLLASFLHCINGPVFAGEGVMLGMQHYRGLMLITLGGIGTMMAGLLSPMGQQLNGILLSFIGFHLFQGAAVTWHYLKRGALSVRKKKQQLAAIPAV